MPTTYLNLTNKLLRRLNEVEIDASDFSGVRGVQSMAKDAIVSAVELINQKEREWPFNAESGSQLLVVGQTEYDFPADLRSVKWDSFHVNKSVPLGVNNSRLRFVSRDYWEAYHKDTDNDAVPTGINVPYMVFEKHGYGFGVSPLPNEAYTVSFDYFKHSPTLTAATDVSTIPSVYDEVIIQAGLYHFYMFRSNTEQSDRAEARFKAELEDMRTNLIDKEDRVRSGMITRYRPIGLPTGTML